MNRHRISTLACCALALAALTRPSAAQPTAEATEELNARLRFFPAWMPVPENKEATNEAKLVLPIPSASHPTFWKPGWQKEVGISTEQMNALLALNAKALADSQQHVEQFKRLTPEEQKAEAKSWAGKPAPWRQQLDNETRKQIEAVLTPVQLQAIREITFPELAIGLLYDAKVRKEIAFGPDQQERFRRLARERLSRFQDEYLTQAEKIWGLMTPPQQTALVDVVKRQGPTSAVLSLAYELGFDPDAMSLAYPMLAEPPVRERLKLSAEQEKQLQAIMADAAARTKETRQGASQPESNADDNKARVEALLTPQQLATLKEINFRRQVVLALGYPEKQKTIGLTTPQIVDLQRIYQETHDVLVPVDRQTLAQALDILTPAQREQLSAVISR
jgi:hypothetical protein